MHAKKCDHSQVWMSLTMRAIQPSTITGQDNNTLMLLLGQKQLLMGIGHNSKEGRDLPVYRGGPMHQPQWSTSGPNLVWAK